MNEVICWRGTINAWECDEYGRLEMRFYVALAWQAACRWAQQAGLLAEGGKVELAGQHIRFLRELRPNQRAELAVSCLSVHGGAVRLLQVVRDCDSGDPLVAFVTDLSCSAPVSPQVETASAEGELPEFARPRGINPTSPLPEVRDLKHGALTGTGQFMAQDSGADGIVRREVVLGRVAEATPHLLAPYLRMVQERTGLSLGVASVEARLEYLGWPREGDAYAVHSAVVEAGARTIGVAHCITEPDSGALIARAMLLGVMMDLETRRAARLPDDVVDMLRGAVG